MVRLFIRTMSELVKRHILCIQALNRYKSTKLRGAIIVNADADLLYALAECAYNILNKNIPLTELQRRRLSKYRTKLRELSQRRAPPLRYEEETLQPQVGEGQSGGFLSAILGKFGLSTLSPRGATQEVEIEHARKMALVDPRLLGTLRSPPPPPTNTLGKKVQTVDDEMMSILDRKDVVDRTKVTLYNQVLQRYNVLSDKLVKESVRVVDASSTGRGAAGARMGSLEGAVGAPSSGTEADVVDTVPKTMQAKARRLMEHLKRDIAWTARAN